MKKAPEVQKKSRKKISFILALAFLVLLAIVVSAGIYFFSQYQKTQALAKNPKLAIEEENKKVVAQVGKLIKLPSETPSVATVSDITKLGNQTLFQNAQNGDKVIIFNKAKRAIVYRPSENLIIEIGNVVTIPGEASPVVSPQAQKVRVVLYNGTGTSGRAKSVGDSLSAKFPNMEVGDAQNASNNYDETLVVDLTGKNKDFAARVAEELDGEVGSIPTGEAKPANADILIILGS